MNSVKALNKIIEYIEIHICEKIDFKTLASIAELSAFDFQRSFSFVTGISVKEYIKRRRLSLAGKELKNANRRMKIIDIALKYGYQSCDAFTRAFKEFHGIVPSKVDVLTELNSFDRLFFEISVRHIRDCLKTEIVTVSGKDYIASYFGESDMSGWSDIYIKRQYWRLENAYADFKNRPQTHEVLPYNNYPLMGIEIGQVFMLDYYQKDGKINRKFYISNGLVWKGLPSTVEVEV